MVVFLLSIYSFFGNSPSIYIINFRKYMISFHAFFTKDFSSCLRRWFINETKFVALLHSPFCSHKTETLHWVVRPQNRIIRPLWGWVITITLGTRYYMHIWQQCDAVFKHRARCTHTIHNKLQRWHAPTQKLHYTCSTTYGNYTFLYFSKRHSTEKYDGCYNCKNKL